MRALSCVCVWVIKWKRRGEGGGEAATKQKAVEIFEQKVRNCP